MSKNNKEKAIQDIPIPDIKFNIEAQEQFGKDKGVVFEHWAATPSPIGRKERGDYRRPDALDTISENGFIYSKVGEFTGTILGNSHSNKQGVAEGGIFDDSTARLMIPRKYNDCDKDISFLPGDRVYAKDIALKVENYEEGEYRPNSSDYLQFPAKCVSRLIDSRGKEYAENTHFIINKDGNLKWLVGKENPGIDPETGKGRIYGIRYQYIAFWYIQRLINEIRITNTNTSSEPARLPYHAIIQREYVYHNRKRGNSKNSNDKNKTKRTVRQPQEKINPSEPEVKVDIRDFSE